MTLSCRIHAARDLRLEELALPELGPHDVQMRLGAGGICGSDLHYFGHGRVGAFVIREPLVPGHEASGIVERIGGAVTRVKPGDKVAVNPSHACGRCDYCLGGRFNLCRKMFFLGSASVFPHAQGLFRRQFVLGEAQLTTVQEDISLGELACAEPLSIGLHAVHRAGELAGRTVLVTGGGTIGCMSVIAARLAGAAEVIVCDIAERPLAIARQVGADRTIRTDQADPASLADIADIAIEAAGSPARWPPAWRPRAAAGASCRWARCRPKACTSRPTASWRASSTTWAPSAPRTPSTGRCTTCARGASTCAPCSPRSCRSRAPPKPSTSPPTAAAAPRCSWWTAEPLRPEPHADRAFNPRRQP